MKPKKTVFCRKGALFRWRYSGSIGGIAFFACPKSKGAEEMLLPGNIITIEGFGSLRFSLPTEAILTMEIYKNQEIHKELQKSGFKPQDTLPEGIIHSYSITRNSRPTQAETPAPKQEAHKEEQERQKLTDHVLKLKDPLFKEIAERIAPLPTDAAPEQRIAKLQELFDLLKKGGGLGIAYEPSEGRMPKTPNQVLTLEKDKTRKADCDEFSLLFIAAAKRLNIGVSDISIGVMKLEVENDKGVKKEEMHAAALMVGNDKYVIDPVFSIFKEVKSFDIGEISSLYEGKPVYGNFKVAKILELNLASTPEQMAAIHYREMAKYHEDKAKTKSGAAKEAELARMGGEVKKGLLLDSESLLLVKMRYSLVHTYLDTADEYDKAGNRKESAEYASMALSLYGSRAEILDAVKEGKLSADDTQEIYSAICTLGRVSFDSKQTTIAVDYFNFAIGIKPKDPLGYQKKIGSLLYIMNEPATTEKIRSEQAEHYDQAKATKEEVLSKGLPISNELQDLFDQIDKLAPSFEKPTE